LGLREQSNRRDEAETHSEGNQRKALHATLPS
jgi:hypothetical protein